MPRCSTVKWRRSCFERETTRDAATVARRQRAAYGSRRASKDEHDPDDNMGETLRDHEYRNHNVGRLPMCAPLGRIHGEDVQPGDWPRGRNRFTVVPAPIALETSTKPPMRPIAA